MEMEIIDSNAERTYVIKEKLLSANFLRFEEILNEFVHDDERDILINLANVQKIDSMWIAALLRVKKKLIDKGRTLRLTNPTESVMKVLELSGLDSYLLD